MMVLVRIPLFLLLLPITSSTSVSSEVTTEYLYKSHPTVVQGNNFIFSSPFLSSHILPQKLPVATISHQNHHISHPRPRRAIAKAIVLTKVAAKPLVLGKLGLKAAVVKKGVVAGPIAVKVIKHTGLKAAVKVKKGLKAGPIALKVLKHVGLKAAVGATAAVAAGPIALGALGTVGLGTAVGAANLVAAGALAPVGIGTLGILGLGTSVLGTKAAILGSGIGLIAGPPIITGGIALGHMIELVDRLHKRRQRYNQYRGGWSRPYRYQFGYGGWSGPNFGWGGFSGPGYPYGTVLSTKLRSKPFCLCDLFDPKK